MLRAYDDYRRKNIEEKILQLRVRYRTVYTSVTTCYSSFKPNAINVAERKFEKKKKSWELTLLADTLNTNIPSFLLLLSF